MMAANGTTAPKFEPPPIQYMTTLDGANIAYSLTGKGVPLVRVPSMFSHFNLQWSKGVLDREFGALSGSFQAVLFDCRGQGSSTRGLSVTTSLEDYVRDLELLVDHLGLRKFVLLGVSAMGKIAVRYAVEHPDRVMALLLNQYTDPNRGTRTGLFQMAKSDWALHLQSSARLGWSWVDPETVVPVLRDSLNQEDFLREYLALSADLGDEMLRRLQVPVLVMATREASGGRPMGRDEEAKRIAAIIPNARLVLFDDPYGGFNSDEMGVPPAISAVQNMLAELPANKRPGGPSPAWDDLQPTALKRDRTRPPSSLSARQMEVLRLVAEGKTNREIAETLVLSERTVQRHIADIFLKLDVRNRVEASAFATNS